MKFLRAPFFTENLWVTASVIMRRQNLSLQITFRIKLYQPEENPTVGEMSEKDVSLLNPER